MDSIIGQLLLQMILIALNAVFACAEIAVITMNDNRLSQLAEDGNKKAIRLVKLTSQPARFLATIQVAITLSGFLGSAFAADNFSEKLVSVLLSTGIGISEKTLDTISVVLITIILAFFTLVFGELVPKRVAMHNAESLALKLSGLISFVSTAFAPLVGLLTVSTNGILRLFGIDPNHEDESVSEEEIRMMVDVGSRKGVIDVAEKEMIQNVFEFDDITVGESATHRTELDILWLEDSSEIWENTIHKSRHSRYPVCDGSVDSVVGILDAKSYFRLEDKSRESVMRGAVSKVWFVLEGMKADELFRRMKQKKNHFAVVLDEYGGTFGVITINDLLERLVGDFDEDQDGLDGINDEIEKLDDGSWRIGGGASLAEAEKLLNVDLPDEDFDTFGGMVLGEYGSIPDDGTAFELDIRQLHVRVLSVKEHRIDTALVTANKVIEQHQEPS